MTQIKTAIARAATSLQKARDQDLSREAINIRRTRLQLLEGVLKEAVANREQAAQSYQQSCSDFTLALSNLLKSLAKMGESARLLNRAGDPLGIHPAIGQHHQRMITRLGQCLNDFKHDQVFESIASNTKKEGMAHAKCIGTTDKNLDSSGDRTDG